MESKSSSTTDKYPRADYVITTIQGSVPYIVDLELPFLNKPRKVFLDDFLYKNSFYDQGGKTPLQKFVGSLAETMLAFRGHPSTLTSKRGNFKLSRERYQEIVENMEVGVYSDFMTGKLVVDGVELTEPADLVDFQRLIDSNNGKLLLGTGFVNKMTEEGRLLFLEDGKLICKSAQDTDLEYLKYMLSIKEMNALAFISENNYRVLFEYFHTLS